MEIQSALYLIPVNISNAPFSDYLPQANLTIINEIKHFIVENVRTARRFIKKCNPGADIASLTFYELNRHSDSSLFPSYLEALRKGEPTGLMSEAGCPAIADPGSQIVEIAQRENLKVIPLAGPSSILMALMASGFNGQGFSFNGYLPIDNAQRDKRIKELENISRKFDMTQIFIETPYRNNRLLQNLIKILSPDVRLCVASNISDPEKENIRSLKVKEWKNIKHDYDKSPAIFLIYAR